MESVTLRKEHRMTIFKKNRVLRRIFGPKREEVAGGWRRLHNEGLHNLYASPTYAILAGKLKGKRLWKIGWKGVDSVHLAQDMNQWRSPVYLLMNLRVP
jgi:hypothetical protein